MPKPKPLSRNEAQELADSLRLLLEQVRNGELPASAATTYRLEGALVALRAVLGNGSEDLIENLTLKGD